MSSEEKVVINLIDDDEAATQKKTVVYINLEVEEEERAVALSRESSADEESDTDDSLPPPPRLRSLLAKQKARKGGPKKEGGSPKPRGRPKGKKGSPKPRGRPKGKQGGPKQGKKKMKRKPALFHVLCEQIGGGPSERGVLPAIVLFNEDENQLIRNYGGCIGRCGAIVRRIVCDSRIKLLLFPNVALRKLYKNVSMSTTTWMERAYANGAAQMLAEATRLRFRYEDFDLRTLIAARMEEMEERRVKALQSKEQLEMFSFFLSLIPKGP
jgi:hypothetical protein